MSDVSGQGAEIALLSVFDKVGNEPDHAIENFAAGLVDLGWDVRSSTGTKTRIEAAGVPVRDIAELVGGAAILGHRVVTLSREVSAGLLAQKPGTQQGDRDKLELDTLGIPYIDLVCVDMYPLEKAIASPANSSEASRQLVIDNTDIGGPTLLREAAKGGRIVLSVAEQRGQVLDWLREGKPNEQEYLHALAARAIYEVARYAALEAAYHNGDRASVFIADLFTPTKYGENPFMKPAGLYADNRIGVDPLGLDQFVHVQGMERSFINMTDVDSLLQGATHIAAGFERNFGEVPPMAIGVKHGNACGAAVAETLHEAVEKMLDGDRRAIFGGVVMINGEIDEKIASTLMHYGMYADQTRLLDGVVAASVSEAALDILTRKKLRVIVNPELGNLRETSLDTKRRMRQVRGGMLEQPNYTFIMDIGDGSVEQSGYITDQQRKDAILAWAIGSTSNSNTITLVKDGKLLANGVGQQDRVGAAQLAAMRSTILPATVHPEGYMKVPLDLAKLKDCVAYSDSFFPFEDGPVLLAELGAAVIVTSSGSVRDAKVKEAVSLYGTKMLMIPDAVARGFAKH